MKAYAIDLCIYDEENIPQPGITILVKSERDLENIPYYTLAENEVIEELMEEHCCEGICFVSEISEKELVEDYETTILELIEI